MFFGLFKKKKKEIKNEEIKEKSIFEIMKEYDEIVESGQIFEKIENIETKEDAEQVYEILNSYFRIEGQKGQFYDMERAIRISSKEYKDLFFSDKKKGIKRIEFGKRYIFRDINVFDRDVRYQSRVDFFFEKKGIRICFFFDSINQFSSLLRYIIINDKNEIIKDKDFRCVYVENER